MVARLVPKDLYGFANFNMQFYQTIILFFQKEAIRKASQREVKDKKRQAASALNMVLLCTPIQLALAVGMFFYGT